MFGRIAPGLRDMGWPVIPVTGKRPMFRGWQQYCQSMPLHSEVEYWRIMHPNANVGLCLGPSSNVFAIDIDCLDPEQSYAVFDRAMNILGRSRLVRIGREPKRLVLYRGHRRSDLRHPVELRGDGTQCVIYGIHPQTNRPYEWPEYSPEELTPAEIPEPSESAIEAFWRALSEIRLPVPAGPQKATLGSKNAHIFDILYKERAGKRGASFYRVLADQLSAAEQGERHNRLVSVVAALARKGLNTSKIRCFVTAHFTAPRRGDGAELWDNLDVVIAGAVRKFSRNQEGK